MYIYRWEADPKKHLTIRSCSNVVLIKIKEGRSITSPNLFSKTMMLRFFVLLLTLGSVGVFCEVDHNSKDWWKRSVFYQIYPRSFYDTDKDGIGDLRGITEKVCYMEYVGVGAAWLSPIYPSPMKDFGYDVQNYVDVDPVYGSLSELDDLIKELTQAGIKLIMDLVPNHSSDQHEWFQKSRRREEPYTDYYIWVDGKGPNGTGLPNNWLGMFGGNAWEWDSLRGQYYYHQFLKEQPDLNYRNPKVREEMKDVIRFWLKRGVAGFRVDAIKHLFEDPQLRDEPPSGNPVAKAGEYNSLRHIYTTSLPGIQEIVEEWRKVLDEFEFEDGLHRVLIMEINETIPNTIAYYGNDTNPLADIPMNFELFNIYNDSSARDVQKLIKNWLDAVPTSKWSNWIIGNHDQPRVANRTHVELIDAFNMINLLLIGTPITYYGEEIGMVDTFVSWNETQDPKGIWAGPDHYLAESRDPQRTPMQWKDGPMAGFTKGPKSWLPVNTNYLKCNVQKEKLMKRSHLQVYRKLVSLRKLPAIRDGRVDYPILSDNVFSFTRALRGAPAFVIFVNFGSVQENVNLTATAGDKFSFPDQGIIKVVSNQVPESSVLCKVGMLTPLNDIPLGPKEAIVIKFIPLWVHE